MTTPDTPTTFSEHFNLGIKKDKLDFLDIYANRDIQVFIDPYGISTMGGKWAKECETQIATYFHLLINNIKKKRKKEVGILLNSLHEVDEIGLGYSSSTPSGRGIGSQQADQLKTVFEKSPAALSGDIRDIADCALLIPGINRDKISDITANIIKKQLIGFTQLQCKKHSIPTQRVAINNVFDAETEMFKSFYAQLPVINGKPKILIPISCVRREPQLSKDKYYRNFVIEFLKAEHSHAGNSLAYVLKNGKIRVNVTDLKAEYPMKAEFLYEFSRKHPQVLQSYKSQLSKTTPTNTKDAKLKVSPKILSASERIKTLNEISIGNTDANRFHSFIFGNLIYIFSGLLNNPKREKEINSGRKRIDIVFDNPNKKGFFKQLNTVQKIHCPKIIIECKNYGREIGNPEIDQLQGRLNSKRGMFGIIICRSIENKKKCIQRCKDVLNDSDRYIIVLDDSDISFLIKCREKKDVDSINQLLQNKIDSLIM